MGKSSGPGQDWRPVVAAELRNELTDRFGTGVDEMVERVEQAYGAAMRAAQIFELAAKLCAAARSASVDNAAQGIGAAVTSGPLVAATRTLSRDVPAASGWDDDFDDCLEEARLRRNRLAHSFWMDSILELTSGRFDELISKLRQDEMFFKDGMHRLFGEVAQEEVERRGSSLDDIQRFGSALLLMHVRDPSRLESLHVLEDGDEVLRRVAAYYLDDAAQSALSDDESQEGSG